MTIYRDFMQFFLSDFWVYGQYKLRAIRPVTFASLRSNVISILCSKQWFSKFFSHSSLTNPNSVNSSQQRSQMITAKVSHYLLWRNNRRLWTKQTLIISVTAYKAVCSCKLLQLLHDTWMVHWIMELDGNRSFTVTLANVTMPQEQRPTWKHPGLLAPLLFNSCISDLPNTVSRK